MFFVRVEQSRGYDALVWGVYFIDNDGDVTSIVTGLTSVPRAVGLAHSLNTALLS